MNAATARPQVLVIGLDPERVPGPWDPAPVVARIPAGMPGLADHGIDATSCLVGLDGSDDIPVVVAEAVAARRWDCVLVGGGLRTEDLLELFETVIDVVHRGAPQAGIAFNAGPDDLWAAVERRLTGRPSDAP